MNDNAKKWVEELLKDGPQIQGQLAFGGARCCLGIACDVYMRETGRGSWGDKEFRVGPYHDGDRLPEPVRAWLGLRHHDGHGRLQPDGHAAADLIEMNDWHGKSLREIGEFIRDHGDEVGLFVEGDRP